MNRINQPSSLPTLAGVTLAFAAILISLCPMPARADIASDTSALRKIYEDKRPSLVAVKYTWESELGSQELVAAGVILSEDGLVMIPIAMVTPQMVPASQIKSFKIVVPSDTQDETEVDATLVSRDERGNLALVRANTPQKWKPITFVDKSVEVGELVYSVGLLPRGAGYKAHVTRAFVSAKLRGPVPQVLCEGDLASVGAPVFNESGEAIGYVHPRALTEALLDNPENPDDMPMVTNPPKLFIPSTDFVASLKDLSTVDKQEPIPWLGSLELKGLDKEFAEFFDLKNTPAVQVGDVVKDSPADKAGLKTLDVIVKFNGQPIERGDMPVELPQILTRKIQRLKPGDQITLGVIHQKGDAPKEITVTLGERPKQPQDARRFYAKDLGFVTREVVFVDTYRRHLPSNAPGVVIVLLRPSAAAQAAKLHVNDMVTQMNGQPVQNLDQFKKDYQQFRKEKPHDPVVLEVTQLDGKQQTINIEPPQTAVAPGGDMQP